MWVWIVVGLGVAACSGVPETQGDVIASDADVSNLLLDGSTLYWDAQVRGGIFELSIDPLDPTPTALVARDAALSAAAGTPTSIAIANDIVYWTNINQSTRSGGSVWSVPVSGGTPTALVAGLDAPLGITVDGANVYFIDDNVLYVTSTQGGNYARVANDVQEFHIANGHGYWTSQSAASIFELDLSTLQAPPTMIAADLLTEAFTVDDTNLYARSTSDLDVVVTELPLAGGQPITLFRAFIDDGAFRWRIVRSGSDVYWNARTEILRIGIDGSGLETLVRNDVDIRSLAVADDAIYFGTTRNGVDTPLGPCSCPVLVKMLR